MKIIKFVLGVILFALIIWFKFGGRDIGNTWEMSCEQKNRIMDVPVCKLDYEARQWRGSSVQVSIYRFNENLHGVTLKTAGPGCKERPWSIRVDRNSDISLSPVGLGQMGAYETGNRVNDLVRQMQAGDKMTIGFSRPPDCKAEEVVVDLSEFAAWYERASKALQRLEDLKRRQNS